MSGGSLLALLKGIFLVGFVAAVLLHARLQRPGKKPKSRRGRHAQGPSSRTPRRRS